MLAIIKYFTVVLSHTDRIKKGLFIELKQLTLYTELEWEVTDSSTPSVTCINPINLLPIWYKRHD